MEQLDFPVGIVRTRKITAQVYLESVFQSTVRANGLPDTTEGDNERLNILADICNEMEEYYANKTKFPASLKEWSAR